MTSYKIEHGRAGQARRLRTIELEAGARFRDIGMPQIAEGEPTPLTILEDRAEHRRLYVAVAEGAPVGFLMWSPKDGKAYVEEVSVHPDHAGHRLARRLIDSLADDVRGHLPALTLATFRDVPWNAPYYARMGFTELPQDQIGPEHKLNWRRQAENGLDMSRRLFMIKPL